MGTKLVGKDRGLQPALPAPTNEQPGLTIGVPASHASIVVPLDISAGREEC
jgi:hypothetical protein